jgi:hypothetical protein
MSAGVRWNFRIFEQRQLGWNIPLVDDLLTTKGQFYRAFSVRTSTL